MIRRIHGILQGVPRNPRTTVFGLLYVLGVACEYAPLPELPTMPAWGKWLQIIGVGGLAWFSQDAESQLKPEAPEDDA